MTRAMLLAAAAAAAMTLAACQKATNTTANDAAGNGALAQANQPVNGAQDAMGAAVGATSAATLGSHDTGAFVENAGQGNMYEIEAAKIAQQRGKNADVKAFAKMMITDHTAMVNEMKPLITKAGKTAPTDLDQRRKGFLDNLRTATAADFDKVYIDQQVAAHQETLTLVNGYADNGDDAGLKAAAAKAGPKVQAHLDRAKALQSQLGSGSNAATH